MDKKNRIIQSAIECFYDKGIEKTTISDITKKANIAQGTFYLYFPSKLSLMPDIAEQVAIKLVKKLNKNVNRKLDIEMQLEQMIDTVFSFVKESKTLYAFIYTGLTQTKHLKEWESIYEPVYNYMENFLKEFIDNGTVLSKLPLKFLAKMLITIIEDSAEQSYLYDNLNEERIIAEKKLLKQFVFDAINTKKS